MAKHVHSSLHTILLSKTSTGEVHNQRNSPTLKKMFCNCFVMAGKLHEKAGGWEENHRKIMLRNGAKGMEETAFDKEAAMLALKERTQEAEGRSHRMRPDGFVKRNGGFVRPHGNKPAHDRGRPQV